MTELLDIHDLRKIFKLGRTAAYQLIHSPGFPEPVALSSTCYRWPAEAVQAYIATRMSRPPAPRPAGEPRIDGVTRPRRRRAGGAK